MTSLSVELEALAITLRPVAVPPVKEIFSIVQEINRSGTTVLLVEQNARMALSIANRAYVLETGRIVASGDAKELSESEEVRKAYLGM